LNKTRLSIEFSKDPPDAWFSVQGNVVGEAVGVGDAVVVGLPKIVSFHSLVQLERLVIHGFAKFINAIP
jgi:hypothetical protein